MLAQLAAVSGGRVAGLIDSGRARITVCSVGVDSAAINAYNKHYYRIDPIASAVVRKPVGTLVTHRDVVSKTWFRRTEFYNDWARPNEFGDCAMVTLFRDQTRAAVFALAAHERTDAFDDEALDLLRQLIPHLQRAIQVTLKMADLDVLHSAGFEALDCLSEGVVLADSTARIVFANRAAEAMLERADGIGVEVSGLCAASSAQTTALHRLIALSARRGNVAEAGGSLQLERPSGRRPLSVTVAPMRRETAWCSMAPPMAIVFVADPEQDGVLSQSRLRALYGMTGTEAAVAGLISKGTGVKAAARKLGIAPSTVRTHLHRVFKKTETKRQAELAHLVNQVASLSGTIIK